MKTFKIQKISLIAITLLVFAVLTFKLSGVDNINNSIDKTDLSSSVANVSYSLKNSSHGNIQEVNQFHRDTQIKKINNRVQSINLTNAQGKKIKTTITVFAGTQIVGANLGNSTDSTLSQLQGTSSQNKSIETSCSRINNNEEQKICYSENSKWFIKLDNIPEGFFCGADCMFDTEDNSSQQSILQIANLTDFTKISEVLNSIEKNLLKQDKKNKKDLKKKKTLVKSQLECRKDEDNKRLSTSKIDDIITCINFIAESDHEKSNKYIRSAYKKISRKLSKLVLSDPERAQEIIEELNDSGIDDEHITTSLESMEARMDSVKNLKELANNARRANSPYEHQQALQELEAQMKILASTRDEFYNSQFNDFLDFEFNEFESLGDRYSDAICSSLDNLKIWNQPTGCKDHGSLQDVIAFTQPKSIMNTDRSSRVYSDPSRPITSSIRSQYLDQTWSDLLNPSNMFKINGENSSSAPSLFKSSSSRNNNIRSKFLNNTNQSNTNTRVLRRN